MNRLSFSIIASGFLLLGTVESSVAAEKPMLNHGSKAFVRFYGEPEKSFETVVGTTRMPDLARLRGNLDVTGSEIDEFPPKLFRLFRAKTGEKAYRRKGNEDISPFGVEALLHEVGGFFHRENSYLATGNLDRD